MLTPHPHQGRYYLSLNVHPDVNTPLDPVYNPDVTTQAQDRVAHKTKHSWYATYQQVQKRLRHTKYFWKTMDVRLQT